MKNKEFYKLLKKNKLNLNSGFTLTELLVGLVMSIFVIGALGFGLMTVLATTQSENSKVQARTENSRALDFISDEVRRARNIETNAANAGSGFSATDKTIVLALDIPEISSSTNAGVRGRIVYYLKSTGLGSWKGPQVLYRWGPPLDANGNYPSNAGKYDSTVAWSDQALIDGINSTPVTPVTSACPTGTTRTPDAPTGFYACITGTNTAQLFLTGQTKTASGVNDSQTNDSQVVARARETLANKTDTNSSVTWSFKDIGGAYNCKPGTEWNMRTNFGINPDNLNVDTTPWDRDTSKQPQPIAINTTKPLVITSSPTGGATRFDGSSDCNSRGNLGTGNLNLNDTNTIKVSHAIDFKNPITFNGDRDDTTVYNNSQVDSTKPGVRFLKKGDVPLFGGYVANPSSPSSDDQPSLGKFLYDQRMAIISPTNTTTGTATEILNNPLTQFIIPTPAQLTASSLTQAQKDAFALLGDDQRIIAFEVGQIHPDKNNDGSAITGNKNPGFDLQDNIFVVTSDVFKTKFESSCFSGSNCNPSTGKLNPTKPNPT